MHSSTYYINLILEKSVGMENIVRHALVFLKQCTDGILFAVIEFHSHERYLSHLTNDFSESPDCCPLTHFSLTQTGKKLGCTVVFPSNLLPYSRENKPGLFKAHAVSRHAYFRAFSKNAFFRAMLIQNLK